MSCHSFYQAVSCNSLAHRNESTRIVNNTKLLALAQNDRLHHSISYSISIQKFSHSPIILTSNSFLSIFPIKVFEEYEFSIILEL